MKIGLPTLLFLIFLTLKLTHHIEWSWLWVTAPLWAGLAIFGAFVVLAVVVAAGTSIGKR